MEINYKPTLPETKFPIVIVGAGGIVKDAHLPAYAKAGFDVVGIYDIKPENAHKLGQQFGIDNVCSTMREIIDLGVAKKAVFDLAVPASEIVNILSKLPDKGVVLIQKPMGENLDQAQDIQKVCRDKDLIAAVNFQLRFAPFVNAARSIIDQGAIGDLFDMEIILCTMTPWHMWDFLAKLPRVEILYHSIHYIDLIRSFLGEPTRIMAKTVRHPELSVASTRSTILLDYGDIISARVHTNHDHDFGITHQQSYIKWEGTRGAIYAKMGLLLDYPNGVPDTFEYCIKNQEGPQVWKTVDLEGSWFPDAFIGTMSSIMRFVEGSETTLPTTVENAFKTMELVEKAYASNNNKSH